MLQDDDADTYGEQDKHYGDKINDLFGDDEDDEDKHPKPSSFARQRAWQKYRNRDYDASPKKEEDKVSINRIDHAHEYVDINDSKKVHTSVG